MVFGADGSDEVRVELRDGTIVVVRPIRPEDRDAVRHAFERLSQQSRFQRFMTGISDLSERDLDYLVEVDHHDHEALIAFAESSRHQAGVARFVRLDDRVSAEAAVTVIDDWQGRGLGTALLTLLAERARVEGVERFTALLLASNEQMLEVLAALGPARTTSRPDGTIEVEVDIPREGIGEHMAGVLRVAAGGTVELATPPWGLREAPGGVGSKLHLTTLWGKVRSRPSSGNTAGSMSQRTAIVQRAHDALNAGDMDALVALCDRRFRLDMSDRVLNPAVYEGHDGIRRFYAEVTEVWESFTWEPTELRELGDLVLVFVHSRGRGRGSGLELDRQSAMLWRIEDERALSLVFYRDPDRALAAAGLTAEGG